MAEAQQHSAKRITTANFIENLNKPEIGTKHTVVEPATSTTPLQALQNSNNDTNNMNHLSDSDLQTLLQNFKDLSNEEQHSLISYLKKLESTEPERVEKLRKFVNIGGNESMAKEENQDSGKISPFATKLAQVDNFDDFEEESPLTTDKKEEPSSAKITIIDSEDEDYSYEDVFQAATKNVSQKEEELRKQEETMKKDFDLINAKTLIANLMGNKNLVNLTGNDVTLNLAQTLNALPVNIENIVGKIQNLTPVNNANNLNTQTTQQGNINKFDDVNFTNKSNVSHFRPINRTIDNNQGHENVNSINMQNYQQLKHQSDVGDLQTNVQYSQYNNINTRNNSNNYENVSYPTTNPYASNNRIQNVEKTQNFYNHNRSRGGSSRGNLNNTNNRTFDNFDSW